jgi:hypothetical protein
MRHRFCGIATAWSVAVVLPAGAAHFDARVRP